MNRAEHYAAAENLLKDAENEKAGGPSTGYVGQSVLIAAAQVHATLASTELVPMPAPDVAEMAAEARDASALRSQVRDLQAALENSEQSRRLAEGLLKTSRDRIREAAAVVGGFDTSAANGPMGRLLRILVGDQARAEQETERLVDAVMKHGGKSDPADDCDETDYDRFGDCDGPVTEFEQIMTGMGKPSGARVNLCTSHARQAGMRGAVRWVLSDGPGQ